MIKTLLNISISFFAISNLSCTHSSRSWSGGMHGMAEAYTKLFPYMYDSQRYSDPNNEKFINLYLHQLNENVSSLDEHTGKGLSGNDPLFTVGLKGLQATLGKASESYFAESYDYSQRLLQSSVNYCNSCHTRTSMGPTFMTRDQFRDIPSQPNSLDKAKMLVAMRQFPKAVDTLEQAIRSEKLIEETRMEYLRRALFVSLKNLESPKRALSVVTTTEATLSSKSFKRKIHQWKSYLNNWPKSKVTKEYIDKIYLEKKINQETNHFASIVRQSMDLHKFLSLEVDRNWRAKVYNRLGNIYAQYPSLGFWDLPEAYFEACIYELPNSKIALKCYFDIEKHLLKDSLKVNSTALNKINSKKLNILKSIATPSAGGPPSNIGGHGIED